MSEDILARTRESGYGGEPALEDVFEASYRRLVIQMYGVVGDLSEVEFVPGEDGIRVRLRDRAEDPSAA